MKILKNTVQRIKKIFFIFQSLFYQNTSQHKKLFDIFKNKKRDLTICSKELFTVNSRNSLVIIIFAKAGKNFKLQAVRFA